MKRKLAHFRWHTIGPTMKRIFHLVYVRWLFHEIWVNFISQLKWKATGFVLSFCRTEDSASSISYPVCAWKMVCRAGDFSSQFIAVQSGNRSFHLTLAFVFPSMKIVHTMTNLMHCPCASWNIPNKTTVNQLLGGRKRGRYWGSQKTKVCFNTLWHFPSRS